MGARSSPGAGSSAMSPDGDRRERLIDAALELFVRQGYDVTTAEQIAAAAGIESDEFTTYFASPEAVLLSLAEVMAHATAAALQTTGKGIEPERALLNAGSVAVTAVVEGRGTLSLERLLATARVVSETRNLHRTVSAARRRVIAPVLAEWMGVDPQNRRLQRALTMWSAVTASAYVAGGEAPPGYDPQRDNALQRRMLTNLAQSFEEVTGEDPRQPG